MFKRARCCHCKEKVPRSETVTWQGGCYCRQCFAGIPLAQKSSGSLGDMFNEAVGMVGPALAALANLGPADRGEDDHEDDNKPDIEEGLVDGDTAEGLARLQEMGMPPIPPLGPRESEEALDILRDIVNTKDRKEMAAKAIGLAKATRDAASKVEFFIYWITDGPNGRRLNLGITRNKSDGENMLAKFKGGYPGAVIRWQGPMDYYTGRQALERSLS